MTDEILNRANYIKDRIKELEFFIWCIERQRTGIIVQSKKIFLNAIPYGALDEKKLECDEELANDIYNLCCRHIDKLKAEYESLT